MILNQEHYTETKIEDGYYVIHQVKDGEDSLMYFSREQLRSLIVDMGEAMAEHGSWCELLEE